MPAIPVAAALAVATIAAVAPGWQGVFSILWLVIVGIAWRHPVVGLLIVALAVPWEQRLSVATLAGDVTLMEYTGWAVTAGSAARLVLLRRVVVDRVATMHLAVVVALGASFAAGGVDGSRYWDVVQGWLLALLIYVVARTVMRSGGSRLTLVSALSVGVIAHAGYAVWQRATGAGPESFVVGRAVRVFGAFLHPNTLAAYLAFALPVLLAVSLVSRSPWSWLWRMAAATGFATLVMTQSRGGMVSLGAAVVVMVALAPRTVQRWLAAGALAGAILVGATGALDRLPGLDRFETIAPWVDVEQVTPETWGQRERQAHWGAAWSMLQSNPAFGVGAGEFSDAFRQHTPEWRYRIARGHAHNGYLQLGAEAGVAGLFAYIGWVGTILVALWRQMVRSSGTDYALAAGALGAAIAWAVNDIFEYQDVPSVPVMFVLIVAAGLGRAGFPGAPVPIAAKGDAP